MSIREGSYTIPAQEASVARAARQLRQAFDDVFRYVPEAERAIPRRQVRHFADRIIIGEQPAPIYWQRETREVPAFAKPGLHVQDGDKYAYRDHTVNVTVHGGFEWERGLDEGTAEARRVLRITWRMESSYVYHAFVNGEDVAGTLDEVWKAQCAAGEGPQAAGA